MTENQNTKLENIFVKENYTIKQTLEIIDQGALKIAIVIDSKEKVIGTISDGDIRRGLLSNCTLNSTIETIYQTNPLTFHINDSKEKIIKEAIKNKIYQIPIVNSEGKLVDVEDLATLLKITNRRNQVILMAGGLGTRLRPLTQNTPKPLLNVGPKPILQTIVESFAKYGFVNITISVNYKANQIKEYFKDGSEFGVNITYIEETKRMGTAGALSLLKTKPKEPFFVMNADLLTSVNFSHLLDFHSFENSMATMCVREYDFQVPYGVIETDGSNITSIIEKPTHNFFVNAGIYVLSPNALDLIPEDEFFDMPTLFEKLIQQKKKTISFPIHEYWLDIGKINDFEKAQAEYHEIFN